MAKLSALVIPAVIDTSGIDKGVNSIRNKLSKVRGQGGGNSGGGNGFSSGVTPYGGHSPFGEGSPVGSAMAAAFGASVGSRTTDKPRDIRRQAFDIYNKNNVLSRGLDRISNWAFAKRREYHRQGKQFLSNMMGQKPWMGWDDARLNPQYQDLMAKGDWWGGGWGYNKQGQRTVPFGQSWRGIGMMAKKSATRIGQEVSDWKSLGGSLGGKLGLGAAAYSFLRGMGSQNMMGRMGDYQRFEGTGYYAPMRGFMRDYYNNTNMGAAQSFWRGQRGATGGTSSFFERLYTGLGDAPGAAAETAGSALSFGGGDSPEQQQARKAYYQERYGGTPMTMGGPVAVGMYKFFKRLFS